MAGINRLGAGPRKPGIARPVDPNRFIVQDLVPEGVENDQDYKRMVQDIEDAQQSQVGWLFGRGAFDKSDLMYLRDEEERQRFTEDELRDRELQQFQKQRARIEPAAPGPLPQRPVRRDKDKASTSVQSKVLSKLKIKAAGLLGEAATPAAQPGSSDGPAAKRQRAEPPPLAPRAAGGEAPGPSSTGAGASGAGAGRSGGGEAGDDDGNGLAGLLSAYGSDEDDEEREEQNEAEAARSAPGAASGRDSGCGGSGKKSVGGLKATLQEIDGKGEDKTDRRSSGRRKKC